MSARMSWGPLRHLLEVMGVRHLGPEAYDPEHAVAAALRAYPDLAPHRSAIEAFEREFGGHRLAVFYCTLSLGSGGSAPDATDDGLLRVGARDGGGVFMSPRHGGVWAVDQTNEIREGAPQDARNIVAFIARWAFHAWSSDGGREAPRLWSAEEAERELPAESLREELSDDLGTLWWTPDVIAVRYASTTWVQYKLTPGIDGPTGTRGAR